MDKYWELVDEVYRKGWKSKGQTDYDPRGTAEWQAAVDAFDDLKQRLYVALDLLQQIHDCPVNWVESTIPKGGMNPNNPRHRGQVVGTQHISYTRLYNIAAFLRQNIEHEKGE